MTRIQSESRTKDSVSANPWLAERSAHFADSGIRKVFDLAAKMSDPIDLSIGQPDFAVPDAIKRAAVAAIEADLNGYSQTQGIPPLRERLQARVDAEYGHDDRRVLVTSGTGGALLLTMLALVDPGDEVIVFDPYFLMYSMQVKMAGGRLVPIDTYPDFRIDVEKVADAITPRTKLILLNSPCNPTGAVADADVVRALAELAVRHNVALVSDEIYRLFSYDGPPASPAAWNPDTMVVDGFSKTYGVTGWRLGWVHGPAAIIDKMRTIQQYTFVCAPHPLQWAGVAALDIDMSEQAAAYARRRDLIVNGLRDADYEVAAGDGALYVLPKVPPGGGTGHEFVDRAIEHKLLMIPGGVFSRRDTHFRISYAASEATIERALEVLRRLR